MENLFYTPKDKQEIVNWIEKHTGTEKTHLYVLAGMIQNFYNDKYTLVEK